MSSAVAEVLDRLRVCDVDTHVTEPPDLWTSRVSSKWGADIPHVRTDGETGVESWFIGDEKITDVGSLAFAEWKDRPPLRPPTLADATPGAWQPGPRLDAMDKHGIYAQALYPNILGFISQSFMRLDPRLQLECVRAYNDFLTEFSAADRQRFIPIAYLPWWDVDASIAELHRCMELGHKGIVFPWELEHQGFPHLSDQHWEPLLRSVEETGLPVNFHIGFGKESTFANIVKASDRVEEFVKHSIKGGVTRVYLGNAYCITELIMSKVCHKYPSLKFVSVESGIGYIPYLMDALDWHFQNTMRSQADREMLLPSEYFRRQIYAMFWFEKDVPRLVDLYPDNFMFGTDYPHPACIWPGPNTISKSPRDHICAYLDGIPEELLVKILQDNAASVYNLSLPGRVPTLA